MRPPLLALKEWLRCKPANAKAIFLTDRQSHLQDARAHALGATDILHRPVNGRELLNMLLGDVAALSADPANATIQQSPAVCVAVETLQNIFSSACLGAPLNSSSIKSAGDIIVGHVETQGLTAWIDNVRRTIARPISTAFW